MNTHTFIFAKITPKAEYFDIATKAVTDIIPSTRNEPGCLDFVLHKDDNGSLYLYEEWSDEQALQQHHDMTYTKAVFSAYQEWLATPPEITKMTKLV